MATLKVVSSDMGITIPGNIDVILAVPEIEFGADYVEQNGLWVPPVTQAPATITAYDQWTFIKAQGELVATLQQNLNAKMAALNDSSWTWDTETQSFVAAKYPYTPSPWPTSDDDMSVVGRLETLFPSVRDEVPFPCECYLTTTTLPIHKVVVHLNDYHEWSREKIADWLETLDIDLTLQPASIGD